MTSSAFVFLRLRGLCPASHLDSFYTIKNEGDRIFLKGPSGTEISLEDGEWKATTTKDQKKTKSVSILASPGSYLLGKHDWIISKDSKVCSQDSLAATTVSAYTYRTSLKLSSCEDNEFTCWDGDCINIGERCDQVFDCSDQSDERDCQMLVLEDSYKRSVPPLISAIAENGTKLIIPAEVVVSLKLIELLGIKERENQIEVKIETKLKWYDYRAKFFNLKKEMLLNTMQLKDVERLWIPRIIYSNMKGGENTKETIDDAIMYVEREGAPAFSGLEIVDENEIFDGKENRLNLHVEFTNVFTCKFQLRFFPFDTQVKISISICPPKEGLDYNLSPRFATSN